MNEARLGRPPMEQARTEVMRVRVIPAAKQAFLAKCQEREVDPAEAHREALALWMRSRNG